MKPINKMRSLVVLLTGLKAFALVPAHAAPELRSGDLWATWADTVGVTLRAKYPQCPKVPVKIDMWIRSAKGGEMEFHRRCFANPMTDFLDGRKNLSPAIAELGYCMYRQPIRQGKTVDQMLLRVWKISSDCQTYSDVAGPITADSYTDQVSSPELHAEGTYPAFEQDRLITVEKDSYTLKMDRFTGVTYEFINKRATMMDRPFLTNSVHAHMGAALQIAIHAHNDKISDSSCDSTQGYWNPTQAGTACTHIKGVTTMKARVPTPAESGVQVHCDGKLSPGCQSATKSVSFENYRIANWDYGRGYEGPYNALDTAWMTQNVVPSADFAEYFVSLVNKGIDRKVVIELPTYYFHNDFRKFHVPDPKLGVKTVNIAPPSPLNIDHYPQKWIPQDIRWISFENTAPVGVKNDNYTIAWFYSPRIARGELDLQYQVFESDATRTIKFNNIVTLTMQNNRVYDFKYVIFPYRYDQKINSRFGRMSVLQVIEKMNAEFAKATP